MKGFLIILCVVILSVSGQAGSERIYRLERHGVSLHLPDIYKVKPMYLDAEVLRRLDYTNDSLKQPSLSAALSDTNALSIECPGGAYAIVFALGKAFPTPDAYYNSIALQRSQVAARESKSADDLLQCSNQAGVLDGLTAVDISVRRPAQSPEPRDPHGLDVFTEILLVHIADKSYGLLLRSYLSAAPTTTTTERLLLQTLSNAVRIDTVHNAQQTIETPKQGFTMKLSTFHKNLKYRVVANPLTKLSGTVYNPNEKFEEVQSSDTNWNTLVVQEPLYQVQVSAFRVQQMSADSLRSALHQSMEAIATRYEPDVQIDDEYKLGSLVGSNMSFTQERRGYVIHRYFSSCDKDLCIVAHVTCWRHDYSWISSTVESMLSTIQWKR